MPPVLAPNLSAFRAQLHQVIDQIQSEAVLQAALLLQLPQASSGPDTAESEEWLQELDQRLERHDGTRNRPFSAVLEQLQAQSS